VATPGSGAILAKSFAAVRLKVWDEAQQQLVAFD
jgi:hypothetical protein